MCNEDKKGSAELSKLQIEKLQSEIDKNKAEQRESEKRTQEIEKRLNQRIIFGIPVYQIIVGAILAGVFISCTLMMLNLKQNSDNAKREAERINTENKLERKRLDSLYTNITAQSDRLEKQMELISARLDSTKNHSLRELEIFKIELENEKSKSQPDQKRMNNLLAQISGLEKVIINFQYEKAQTKRVLEALDRLDVIVKPKLVKQNVIDRTSPRWAGIPHKISGKVFIEVIDNKKIAKSPYLSSVRAKNMITRNNYFDKYLNPQGTGIKNKYKAKNINGDKVIIDRAKNLTWQQGGSEHFGNKNQVEAYIRKLRRDKFASFDDWRLPTLEEAMSLMESRKKNGRLFIDPIFNPQQKYILTSDKQSAYSPWVVYFYDGGSCRINRIFIGGYVRAVRGEQFSSLR